MDNRLGDKLNRFQEAPPQGAWEKIIPALDEPYEFTERLYNYHQLPSELNWKKIEEKLDVAVVPAKVIPFATRFKKPIQVLAAASIITVIAISLTLALKRTEAGALQAGTNTTVPIKEKTPPLIVNPDPPKNLVVALTPASKKTQTHPDFKRRLLNIFQPQKKLAFAVAGKFLPRQASNQALFNNNTADSYMVFSDGAGMAIRLPKKLFPIVRCNDGDASCLQRINTLQQKLSTASLTADFTAVLEMLREVQ